ncbi:MAG: DNA internalization-related competence protein ComEC/Rec2 [Clostridiales Family XIII bacterium]|jgi:competence protein ComEC|nr:DNA internalization-related competence protein ComEC/Rec2 [Clostridiales Family XIII bacterium]
MNTRRPLLHVTLAYALGIAWVYLFAPRPLFFVAPALAGTALLLSSRPRPPRGGSGERARRGRGYRVVSVRMGAVMLLCFVAGGAWGGIALNRTDPLEAYAVSPYNHADERVPEDAMPVLSGRVMKIALTEEGGGRMTVRSDGRNILLRVKGEGIVPSDWLGRRIVFSGEAELPSGRRNPGCFDYRLYLMTQNVRVIVKCDAINVTRTEEDVFSDPVGGVYNALGRLKYGFLDRAAALMDADAYGLFAGMLFGDTSAMDEDIYEMFRANGVSHILSVSGLHVAIVYGFFNVLFGGRRSVPVCLVVLAFLFVYALLSEFSPPVIRAVVMISVHILAKLMSKRYDLLTGICAAALLILLINPLQLFGVGFQLSFLAVLLLAFGIPVADRFIGFRDARTGLRLSGREIAARGKATLPARFAGKAVGAFTPLLIIQIGMAPMIAYCFNYLSLSGVLLNIPVVAVSGLILPVGILMIPVAVLAGAAVPGLSAFASALFAVLARVSEILLDAVTRMTEIADALPFSHFQTVAPRVQWVFLFYGLLFFCLSETCWILFARRCFRPVLRFLAGFALAVTFTLTSPVCVRDESALVFVDVGQGDCLHIRTPDGRNYLVDGGGQAEYDVGKNVLLPYLLKNGVSKIDGAFLSHLHTDHYKGIRELSLLMPVERLFLYDGNRVRADTVIADSGFEEEDLVFLAQGDRADMGKGVSLTALYPPKGSAEEYERLILEAEDENRTSLLMRLEYDGVSVLMTGDMGAEGEAEVLRDLGEDGAALRVTALKVGHHGSKTSTTDAFLRAADPEIAVIQVGRNTFGHPTAEILEKLRGHDIMTYRNDLDGAVAFDIEKGRIRAVSTASPSSG